jgi:hypothetical protein
LQYCFTFNLNKIIVNSQSDSGEKIMKDNKPVTKEEIAGFTTGTLMILIEANVAVQKRNRFDSQDSINARRFNRPLMAEMATRQDAPPVK